MSRSKEWKSVFTVITTLALLATAYALRAQIIETIQNLREANPWPLLLVPPLAGLNHYAQGKIYQGLFRTLGHRFRTRAMMRLSFELNFVNTVFPSAGVSGFSYLSLRMKGEDISTAKATLAQIMRFALLFVSFQIFLAVGLLLLAVFGRVSNFVVLITSSLATLLLVGTLALIYIISSKERISNFFTVLPKILNRIIHIVRPKHPETINISRLHKVLIELHENYLHLKRNVRSLRRPLYFALLANGTEVASIFMVFLAFGQLVNPGAIIIAYAVANFAGLISVLPGGVGIYEGLMTGVFAAAGVSPAVSLPVVLAFRVTSMGTQLPVGYYFYTKTIHYLPPDAIGSDS